MLPSLIQLNTLTMAGPQAAVFHVFFIFLIISRITLRVRNLLLLIPTDPEVQDALDNFVPKESSVWSHQVHQTAKAER